MKELISMQKFITHFLHHIPISYQVVTQSAYDNVSTSMSVIKNTAKLGERMHRLTEAMITYSYAQNCHCVLCHPRIQRIKDLRLSWC